jgi:hypothetical protein
MNEGGVYRSTWPLRARGQPKPDKDNIDSFERLDLIAIRGKGVHIEYVGPTWRAELDRRHAVQASPF